MSGTFPTTIEPSDIELISNTQNYVSTADSGKRQVRNAGGHLWGIDLSFPIMTREKFESINAFIMNQKGSAGSFQYIPKTKATPLGVASGSPAVSIAASAGDTSFLANGMGASIVDYVKAGDVFKFASHDKVYMCVQDEDSTASSVCSFYFQPELVQDVAVLDAITLVDVPFTVYVDDVHKYKVSRQGFAKYSVKLIESL